MMRGKLKKEYRGILANFSGFKEKGVIQKDSGEVISLGK